VVGGTVVVGAGGAVVMVVVVGGTVVVVDTSSIGRIGGGWLGIIPSTASVNPALAAKAARKRASSDRRRTMPRHPGGRNAVGDESQMRRFSRSVSLDSVGAVLYRVCI
jgi:hypothetical protein